MSRSSEAAIQQQEQDNLSGMEHTAYMSWNPKRVENYRDDKNKELKEVEE